LLLPSLVFSALTLLVPFFFFSIRVLTDVGEAPFQRCWHVAFGSDRGMYVFGGVFFTAEKQLVAMNDLLCFDWETARWRKVVAGSDGSGEVPPAGWAMSCAAVPEQQGAYMIGGRDREYNVHNVLWKFDADTEAWTRVSDKGPRMCAGGLCCIGGGSQLLAFGGIERFTERKASCAVYSNRVFVFDIESGVWHE
jgi:N-acetylneuraminic acid mutarotase